MKFIYRPIVPSNAQVESLTCRCLYESSLVKQTSTQLACCINLYTASLDTYSLVNAITIRNPHVKQPFILRFKCAQTDYDIL